MTEDDLGLPLVLETPRGKVRCRWHPAHRVLGGGVWVGGFDGGFDGPADKLYPDLCDDLSREGVASLRIEYRHPEDQEQSVYDVLAGVAFLAERGAPKVGLVGHSYGAAVIISAAARSNLVGPVVTLSAQTAGTQLIAQVSPRPLLLIHGLDDIRLPPDCSRYLYALAGEPKKLVLLPGARHSLRQRRAEVRQLVREWLLQHLIPRAEAYIERGKEGTA